MKPTILTSLHVEQPVTEKATVTTKATGSAVAYSAAEFLGGLILRDPAGAARTDITPTAASLYQALNEPGVGASFRLIIRNTADQDETITMQGGTNVTISGTATIAQNNTKEFLIVFTSETAATMYSLGTIVH